MNCTAHALTLLVLLSSSVLASDAERPNVLFIAVDDLKPLLNCQGHDYVHTPNFDRLAEQGCLFRRAYCQQALCGPTRVSLLTGRYPDVVGIYSMGAPHTWLRQRHPDIVTLPQYFRENGYHTTCIGKIYDPRNFMKGGNDPKSWTERAKTPPQVENAPWGRKCRGGYLDPETCRNAGIAWRMVLEAQRRGDPGSESPLFKNPILKKHNARPAVECMDVPDEAYDDGRIADWSVGRLKRFAADGNDRPFFLAVGFLKPHLPFVAPKKYWDLYDRQSLPVPGCKQEPTGMPALAHYDYVEGRTYNGVPDEAPISEETDRFLLHGYLACISYIDAQVGKLLDTLEETGLDENTVVVAWGDHGFHTGDHGLWGKHTNWEQATHAPLIIRAPWVQPTDPTDSFAEFVDIYPTLCDLAGLPVPSSLDGRSLVRLMRDPTANVRDYAASVYTRSNEHGKHLGYTIRTDRYRYIGWYRYQWQSSGSLRVQGKPVAAELYDYLADPDETENLAGKPEYRNTESELAKFLQSHVDYSQSQQL